MKNYIYILGLALSMSSCEDFLTRDNPTGITCLLYTSDAGLGDVYKRQTVPTIIHPLIFQWFIKKD